MRVRPYAIYVSVDTCEVPGCHLLREMSSQLLQGSVSHELLTANLSVFNLFLTQKVMAILS